MAIFDPRGLVETLQGYEVDYVVIGGIAVGAHGFQRATKDLDIVPNPDRRNLGRLEQALQSLEAQIDGVDVEMLEIKLDAEGLSQGGNFVLSTSKGRLDLMQFQGDYELYGLVAPNATEVDLGYAKFRVCSLADLIKLKLDAGRPQDLLDVQQLEKLSSEPDLS